MKVCELIEILEELDPEASVYLMSQQNWPYAERRFMRSVLAGDRVLGRHPRGPMTSRRSRCSA